MFRPWGRCRRSSFSVTLTTCTTRDMLGTNRQGCYGISSVACSQAAQQPQHWRITLTSWFKRHQVGHRDFQPCERLAATQQDSIPAHHTPLPRQIGRGVVTI